MAALCEIDEHDMSNIQVHKGDITTAEVDAIVNAANPKMLGGGGVDGAIHQAAGPRLLESCRKVKATNGIRCPFGEARITSAGNLSAKFVIHAVGPRYKQEKEPEKLLASAYRQSMNLALQNNCTSIAFPALSCGAYGYPAAVRVCSDPQYCNMSVEFYMFTAKLYETWIRKVKSA